MLTSVDQLHFFLNALFLKVRLHVLNKLNHLQQQPLNALMPILVELTKVAKLSLRLKSTLLHVYLDLCIPPLVLLLKSCIDLLPVSRVACATSHHKSSGNRCQVASLSIVFYDCGFI